jgi:hypothetical protein
VAGIQVGRPLRGAALGLAGDAEQRAHGRTGNPGTCGSSGSADGGGSGGSAGNGGSGSPAAGGGGGGGVASGCGAGAGVGVGAPRPGLPGGVRGRDGRVVRLELIPGRAWRAASRVARATVSRDGRASAAAACRARAASTTASWCDSVTGEAAPAPEVPSPVLTQSTPAARAAIASTKGAAPRTSLYRFGCVGIYTETSLPLTAAIAQAREH